MSKPIKTEAEYDAALSRVEEMWDDAQEGKNIPEFEALINAIESYESIHYPMDILYPIEDIKKEGDCDS